MIAHLGVTAWLGLTGHPRVPTTTPLYLSLIPFAVGFAALAYVLRQVVLVRRRLREHDFRLCVCCQYPLPAEPAEGVCPECGNPYRLSEAVAAWRESGRLSFGAALSGRAGPPRAGR
ncbi:MAG TPA: hypothetical protein VEB22_05025 [Phycisphaerales bacterium]|nr:hypothetical protein [Phycisphaerales bacterium]